MKFLIIHSLTMHKVQTISVTLSVILSVAASLALFLIYGGVTKGVEVSEQQGGAQIMVIPKDSETYLSATDLLYTGVPAPIYMDEGVFDKVKVIDGITQATAQFFAQTLDSSCCSASQETRLIGVDFSTDFIVKPLVPHWSGNDLAPDEVILGNSVDGVVDGVITIIGKSYRVAATMSETGAELDDSIIIDIIAARDIAHDAAGYGSFWEKYGQPDNLISCIMVNADTDEAVYGKTTNKLHLMDGVTFVERSNTLAQIQKQLRSVFVLLLGSAIVMTAISLIQLFARFYSCVWDRKSELALYRAVGASKADIKKLIGGEIAVMVLGGLIIGFAVGGALYTGLMFVLKDSMTFPFLALDPISIALGCLAIVFLFTVIAFVSIAWPLRQIGRIDPSLAMQQGDID